MDDKDNKTKEQLVYFVPGSGHMAMPRHPRSMTHTAAVWHWWVRFHQDGHPCVNLGRRVMMAEADEPGVCEGIISGPEKNVAQRSASFTWIIDTENMTRWPNAGSMLFQRLRRWNKINPELGQRWL